MQLTADLELGLLQAECEASMMHGAELADARAAVWQSAAGRLLEVRDAADGLVSAHVRHLDNSSLIPSMTAICALNIYCTCRAEAHPCETGCRVWADVWRR